MLVVPSSFGLLSEDGHSIRGAVLDSLYPEIPVHNPPWLQRYGIYTRIPMYMYIYMYVYIYVYIYICIMYACVCLYGCAAAGPLPPNGTAPFPHCGVEVGGCFEVKNDIRIIQELQ